MLFLFDLLPHQSKSTIHLFYFAKKLYTII